MLIPFHAEGLVLGEDEEMVGKKEERVGLGWVLERDGQEPLALVHLVLLHLAEWCTEGPLNAHKGNTNGYGCGLGVDGCIELCVAWELDEQEVE